MQLPREPQQLPKCQSTAPFSLGDAAAQQRGVAPRPCPQAGGAVRTPTPALRRGSQLGTAGPGGRVLMQSRGGRGGRGLCGQSQDTALEKTFLFMSLTPVSTCGFFPHTKQFSGASRLSYNSAQLGHFLSAKSVRSRRLRAQPAGLSPLQPIATPGYHLCFPPSAQR